VNTRSLSFRLVTWYAGVLTAVFVVLGGLTFVSLRHYLEANVLDNQARRARQIAATLVAQASREREAAMGAQVENLYSPEGNDRFIRITRTDGAVVYASGPPRAESFAPSQVPELGPGDGGATARKAALAGGALLIATVPATASDGTRYRVEVGTSAAPLEATLRRLLGMLAVGLPVTVAVAVAGGFVLVRRALDPVERITRKAQEITQHNLSERLPVVRSGDELERLSVALNHMIARLQEAIDGSKQFVADASHELRTPLASTTAEQMSLLATDKNVSVACHSAAGVMVEGDPARLKQVIVNLLDNAIKYTAAGGRVRLSVRREQDSAVLEVADDGIGIPAEALPHVFKRFFRVDSSRSREQGGAGLGLAIVKSICSAHGAEIEVVSAVGKGSTFRLRQPLAGDAPLRA